MPLLRSIKRRLVPKGYRPRRCVAGLNRGLRMELDLRHDTQRWLGLAERELAPWFHSQAHIDTAFDVGASDGYYSLFLLARTTAERVIAFEPEPDGVVQLRHNLALNRLSNSPRFSLVQKRVGAADHESEVRLDGFESEAIGRCFVKVDVEGAELDVLLGAQRLLEKPAVSWLIETHAAALERSCVAELERHGYRTSVIDHAWWRVFLPEHRPIPHNRWLWAERAGT